MRPDELERRLQPASTPSVPLPAPNCSTSSCSPDLERAERIGEFWGYPESRTFTELLIDCEEDRGLRAVLVVMLRERSDTRNAYQCDADQDSASDELSQ